MLKIRTVCSNGLGSSLMCATKVKKICATHGIEADVAQCAFSEAPAEKADLYLTMADMASDLAAQGFKALAIRSYTNATKLEEDILPTLLELKNK
ncbi:PTS sugar transporter subunit IIB [Psittacicella hinzii]|uniref:PTS EIIB type-2 domain-containing protein n=1 Tax=Psittacicella hinzii TaxID=2028575 RepID=A0A3A1YV34_9GAMM|nr:PTS sugar transporter subunit IIB [Psittacicella hinzii]RIY40314.1 hypothetical protein CKF58_00685 [Psittacicella hinzii]